MQDRNHIKGFLWNMLGSAMYGANSFVMLAIVSRVGTVEQVGYFGIAFTTAQIFYVIGIFGVSFYQMTDYNEKFHFMDYARVRILSVSLVIISCAVTLLVIQFTGEKAIYLVLLTILMLLNAVGDLYQSLFFQKNRLDLSGSALFFRTLWPLLLFCSVLIFTYSIILALVFQIIVNLVITAYYAIKVAPQFLTAEANGSATKKVLALVQECTPLFVSLLTVNVIINFSKYGVEFLMDAVAQGYYNMIFMPVYVINLCSQFMFKPFLNQYSKLIQDKKNQAFLALLMRQIACVAGLTGICCVAAFWLGSPVLSFLYQKDITKFVVPLTLIVFGGGIFALDQLFYCILVILRQQKDILVVYIIALLLSIFPTFLLIKCYGLSGAAISFALTHGLILLCYTRLLFLYLKRHTDV